MKKVIIMSENKYLYLKSGTDIRGTAVAGVPGEEVELTDEAVFDLTVGFCKWLKENGYNKNNKIAVGHDSRISAERIKNCIFKALSQFDYEIYDCSCTHIEFPFTSIELVINIDFFFVIRE